MRKKKKSFFPLTLSYTAPGNIRLPEPFLRLVPYGVNTAIHVSPVKAAWPPDEAIEQN